MRAKRLTSYVGEGDQWHHQPLYRALVEHLKTAGCAGATATRALAGFGSHHQIHTAGVLDLSTNLPVVITAVDTPENIERILPEVAAMIGGGLITIDDTEIYGRAQRNA